MEDFVKYGQWIVVVISLLFANETTVFLMSVLSVLDIMDEVI